MAISKELMPRNYFVDLITHLFFTNHITQFTFSEEDKLTNKDSTIS